MVLANLLESCSSQPVSSSSLPPESIVFEHANGRPVSAVANFWRRQIYKMTQRPVSGLSLGVFEVDGMPPTLLMVVGHERAGGRDFVRRATRESESSARAISPASIIDSSSRESVSETGLIRATTVKMDRSE